MFFSDFYKFKISVFIIVELDSSSDFYQGSPGWSHRTYTHCLKTVVQTRLMNENHCFNDGRNQISLVRGFEGGKVYFRSTECFYVLVKSLSRVRLFETPWLTRLLHPWNFPGKSTGVGCHFLLQGIFPTQASNPGLPHCRQTLYHLSHQRRPFIY